MAAPPSAAGTYTVQASFPGSTDYAAQSAQATFTITQATPTITWNAPGSIVYGTALASTQLDATANMPGTFTYTPAAGTVLGVGTTRRSPSPSSPTDSTDYKAATATTTIVVAQATPTLTWNTPAAITYGTALGAAQLDATASVPGTFTYIAGRGDRAAGGH